MINAVSQFSITSTFYCRNSQSHCKTQIIYHFKVIREEVSSRARLLSLFISRIHFSCPFSVRVFLTDGCSKRLIDYCVNLKKLFINNTFWYHFYKIYSSGEKHSRLFYEKHEGTYLSKMVDS